MSSQQNDPPKRVSVRNISNARKPPIKLGWILIAITFLCYVIPLPTKWIAWILNFLGFITSIIVIADDDIGHGATQLLINVFVLPFLYEIVVFMALFLIMLYIVGQDIAQKLLN